MKTQNQNQELNNTTYLVECSTNGWQASRNLKFKQRETSYIVSRGLTKKEAIDVLADEISNCGQRDTLSYYTSPLDMIKGLIEDHLCNILGHYVSDRELEEYYNSTAKRWAVYSADILGNWDGEGYYHNDSNRLCLKKGAEMAEYDGYSYKVVNEAEYATSNL